MKKTVNLRKVIAVISSFIMMVSMLTSMTAEAMTYCTLTYLAGDVDNLVGSTSVSFEKIINTTFDAAASSRFSRKGYYIKSWYVPSTGETVRTGAQYVMPDHDITFVANWEPQTYSVTFTGKGGKTADGSANFYVDATYGTAMILPENQFIYDGYTFTGWKYDGVTYKAGDEFQIPAILSTGKIVISAVWTKTSSSTVTTATTTAATTAATTTTTTVTTTTTSTSASSSTTTSTTSAASKDAVVKTFEIGAKLDYTNESMKIYNISLDEILSEGTIDKFEINLRSSIGTIGTVIAGVGTVVDGEWYQIDYNENINTTRYTIDFADQEICNKLSGGNLQIGYWWGSTVPLYLDSVTVTYKPQEITTTEVTTPATTTTVTAPETSAITSTTISETVPVTTTSEAAPVTTTSETTTAAAPVVTTTVTTFKDSQYSKIVEINKTINVNDTLTLAADELISANQIVESIQLTFSADGQPLNGYTLTVGMARKDNGWEQFNYSGTCDAESLTVGAAIAEEAQAYITNSNFLTIGYWWGETGSITLESVKVNYRIDSGDFNKDGVVGTDDAEALKKYMVGVNVEGFEIDGKSADVNGDGAVNVFDYMYLSRML